MKTSLNPNQYAFLLFGLFAMAESPIGNEHIEKTLKPIFKEFEGNENFSYIPDEDGASINSKYYDQQNNILDNDTDPFDKHYIEFLEKLGDIETNKGSLEDILQAAQQFD